MMNELWALTRLSVSTSREAWEVMAMATTLLLHGRGLLAYNHASCFRHRRRHPFLTIASSSLQSVAAPPPPLKIIAIAGSFRKASTHQGLVRAAIEIARDLPGLEIEPISIAHLPFVNTDLEVDGRYPDAVEEFRAKVLQANSVLFACPEYNYSVPGVLKNAIDWASRPPNVWDGKPAAIMSAGGNMGGARAQYHLRQTGVYVDLHFLNRPELQIRAFEPPTKFDKDGNLVDIATRERLTQLLLALQKWTLKLQNS